MSLVVSVKLILEVWQENWSQLQQQVLSFNLFACIIFLAVLLLLLLLLLSINYFCSSQWFFFLFFFRKKLFDHGENSNSYNKNPQTIYSSQILQLQSISTWRTGRRKPPNDAILQLRNAFYCCCPTVTKTRLEVLPALSPHNIVYSRVQATNTAFSVYNCIVFETKNTSTKFQQSAPQASSSIPRNFYQYGQNSSFLRQVFSTLKNPRSFYSKYSTSKSLDLLLSPFIGTISTRTH